MLALALASAQAPRLIVDLLVILAAAALVAAVFRRARFQTITGFVVAGAIVGPNAWGLVKQPENVDQISALATMLLMFGIGLQLDLQHIRRGMVSIIAIGVASTLASVLALWPGGVLLGLDPPQALAAALAFSISSTAVLIRVLLERREVNQQHGRITLGVSLIQDLLSVAVLSLMPALAYRGGTAAGAGPHAAGSHGISGVQDAFMGLGAVTLFIFAGRLLLPRLMNAVATLGGDPGTRGGGASGGASELILVFSAAIAVGAAIASAALGLSPELGAFIAGFLLGSTPFRHQLVGQYAPLRDLLMAVFFTSVGLKVDPSGFLAGWFVIAAAVVGVIVVKGALVGACAWALGASPRVAALSGVYLANAGEFSFVILAAAAAQGILGPQGEGNAIAVVILTLIISPALLGPSHAWADRWLGSRLAPWIKGRGLARHADQPEPAETRVAGKRVIIAGFGPVGRHIADRFTRMGTLVTVIDLNPRTIDRQTNLGRDVVFGDVTSREVLESAGLANADALILTIPDEDAMIRACATARAVNPGLFIAARAGYLSRGLAARQAGADHVTVEELATAEVMERQVVEALTLRDELAVPRPDAG
jgi:Kef-type K+ transport system membrane component KefB